MAGVSSGSDREISNFFVGLLGCGNVVDGLIGLGAWH